MTAAQLPLRLPWREAMDGGNFIVGPSNAAAVAWIDAWPRWPASGLVLYGPHGSGKSHLAEVWRSRSGAVTIRPQDVLVATVPALVQHHRLILDGADRVEDEQAFFHLLNQIRETSGDLLLLATQATASWPVELPDLSSRLRALPAVALEIPDDVLLAALIAKLFSDRQIIVPDDVIEYVLPRIERSPRIVQALVEEMDAEALGARRRMTVPLARGVLARLGDRGLTRTGKSD